MVLLDNSSQREKDAEYADYLRHNEMEGIKEGGITNAGFEPTGFPNGYPYDGKMQGFSGKDEPGPSYSTIDAAALIRHSQMMQMGAPGQVPVDTSIKA